VGTDDDAADHLTHQDLRLSQLVVTAALFVNPHGGRDEQLALADEDGCAQCGAD